MSDAVVIGAGPAGSIAAMILARAGWQVTLVEQHRFPRDKVCGECLSAVGIDVLGRLGLADSIADLRPVALSRATLYAPDGTSVSTALPRPMLGLSRMALDSFLLEKAREAGAHIRQPARCESLTCDSDRPTVPLRDLTRNSIETLSASHVLIA